MLQKCPECERSISDQATACPGCGYAVAKTPGQRAQDLVGAILVGVAAIIGAWVVLIWFSH